jgi:Na+-transporting NADH:ubiquinone oxidoreductase subunit NqrB
VGFDPRWYQIVTLSTLLLYGLFVLDFEVLPQNAAAILITSQLTQWAGDRWAGRPYDPRSAIISSLSLCLLLRTNSVPVAMLAAAVAIGSKFVIRVNGKHVYNPANLGIVAAVLLTGEAWISPGQWGNAALAALFFASAGTTVVQRAERSDVTFAFLGFYAGMVILRSVWLGEPMAIPMHRLQSGALLLFAFFMISDPKTTPDSRPARILYAFLVALGAYAVHFLYFRSNGLIWSLFALAPAVPLFDLVLRGRRFQWTGRDPLPVTA